MESFNVKDILNYIISGYLWIVFLVQLPFMTLNQSILVPKEATEILLLTMACYFVGNVFRVTDVCVIKIFDFLFGDLYQCALHPDKLEALKQKNGKIGFLNNGKHTKSLGDKVATRINEKLIKLELYSNYKKNQFLLTETYVATKYKSEKVIRLKDLHNFFESLLLPSLLLLTQFAIYLVAQGVCGNSIANQIGCFLVLCITYFLAAYRYRYLKSNFIKEIYKTFLFI